MKNEIGRKLTSLTIMAIMFAGGMAIGVPSFMPEAASDLSATDGKLTVSSTQIQGAQILEIVVNDADYSDTTVNIDSGPTVTILGTSYETTQGVNGKWYLYVVDNSVATDVDNNTTDNGLEFGVKCTTGLGTNKLANVIPTGTNVWAEAYVQTQHQKDAGGCLDIDNMRYTFDDSSSTVARELMSATVLRSAPSLSNHNDANTDLGQQNHALNASGYGSWPYILSIELMSTNIVEYGSDALIISFGENTDTDVGLNNNTVADDTEIHLWFSDSALNIDPTKADTWIFNLNSGSGAMPATTIFANNGTNTAFTIAQMGSMQFGSNGFLTVDDASTSAGQVSSQTAVTMTESGPNTGVFESWDAEGTSAIRTIASAAADKQHTFKYGGNGADLIIAYNNAVLSMDAGAGVWQPATSATITINDPDLNKNPSIAETITIGNSSSVIPTIKVGSPLTLAGGNNAKLHSDSTGVSTNGTTGVVVCGAVPGSVAVACGMEYKLTVYNTSDNSERLRIIHAGGTANPQSGATTTSNALSAAGVEAMTTTWINVTTGHTRANLVDLPGTVVLSYDISGPAGQLGSTDVNVYVTDAGSNTTNNSGGVITIVSAGNVRAGVYALDDDSEWIRSTDISTTQSFTTTGAGTTGSSFISIGFQITHAAGGLTNTEDYAISADFCNFDQNNGSLVHNCIYRLEAVETGANTGIFEGTVEYITLNNSSNYGTRANSGEHDGNDHSVAGLLTGVSGDALIVVMMDAVSGSDAVRVVYNDTDALQVATKRGAQLDTVTHTGTVELDAGNYGVDDMATITITDPDLNQDSSVRDIYQNSSTTFNVTVTPAGSTIETQIISANITIIETSSDSGVFVGTFKVPDSKGGDMEVVYYESKDAGSSAVSYYDTATISSNSGTVSWDRSVYPVPFVAGDLREGNNDETGQDEAGNVTAWITVSDVDFTGDTLTTTTSGSAGSILVKLVQGSTTSTCFTAGSAAASGVTDANRTSVPQELGPFNEIEMGTSVYDIKVVIDEVQHCGSVMKTVVSGDIIQVEYVDTADDTGGTSTSYDSSTFDLRTGSLSVDKDVYVLGSDVVITLTDPDLNLDSTSSESYSMSIIEWDSAADSSCLLDNDSSSCTGSPFTSNPSSLEETGSDTGVFQTVLTLPTSTVSGSTIKYGESITLTYVDVGLSGENTTEDAVLDVEAYFSISNFGALVELDKAVYNWTDIVYFTITSPDHNVNTAAEETIGTSTLPIQVSTRVGKLCTTGDKTYFGAETGVDTGVFTGEIQLAGFAHQMSSDSDAMTPAATGCNTTSTGGVLRTSGQTDGISVSYEYNDSVVVVASASIIWNIGEASWDSSAVSAGGSAVLTIVDADENVKTTIIDTFTVAVFSDSDNGGFTLTMNETDEDTGVFEGTVFFTSTDATSGTNLRVSEGDTVTAEYTDETLPEPYTASDDLTIAATTTVGTAFPPLERAPAANARIVDAFGSSVAEVTVDQQVQIAADVSNGQDSDQAFAYLVQVQDENGVTVSLAWITGSLTAGQSMSPALSWTPSAAGTYTATVFVWESVDNPTALSPTTSVTIDVV